MSAHGITVNTGPAILLGHQDRPQDKRRWESRADVAGLDYCQTHGNACVPEPCACGCPACATDLSRSADVVLQHCICPDCPCRSETA